VTRHALTLALCGLTACPFAPKQDGYVMRAPQGGPSKIAPEGFHWEQRGGCVNEERRDPYNADIEVVRLCDWVLMRDTLRAAEAAAATGCTKDTDCKGDRICTADRCVDP